MNVNENKIKYIMHISDYRPNLGEDAWSLSKQLDIDLIDNISITKFNATDDDVLIDKVLLTKKVCQLASSIKLIMTEFWNDNTHDRSSKVAMICKIDMSTLTVLDSDYIFITDIYDALYIGHVNENLSILNNFINDVTKIVPDIDDRNKIIFQLLRCINYRINKGAITNINTVLREHCDNEARRIWLDECLDNADGNYNVLDEIHKIYPYRNDADPVDVIIEYDDNDRIHAYVDASTFSQDPNSFSLDPFDNRLNFTCCRYYPIVKAEENKQINMLIDKLCIFLNREKSQINIIDKRKDD
jgi:hypothetical protein